jgi:hypothetical protein
MRPGTEGKGSALRERIYWWWKGVIGWLLDLPYACGDARRRYAERARLARWDLTDRVLDLLDASRARLRALVTVRRRVPLLAVAGDAPAGGGTGFDLDLARRGQELEALEHALTHRQRRLQEREAELAERQAQVDARGLEVEQRGRWVAERERALDVLESEAAMTRAGSADRRETEWWQKQLGPAVAGSSTDAARARRRFDPATASALRRTRRERRLRD